MSFLTIFTTPKPFVDPHIATIQRNAIRSWLHLGPEIEVLLVGDEPGMNDVAQEYGIKQLKEVNCNEQGTPLVSSIFNLARHAGQTPLLVYVNADIIFLPDLVESARQVYQLTRQSISPVQSPRFLMIGQRWDLDVRQSVDFSGHWEQRLRADLKKRGQLHAPAGSDFFVFPRELFQEMPDFAIGRAGWDNWMIYQAKRQGWPVIDGTPSVTIIHQNHDYSHLPDGKPHYELPESDRNTALAGGSAHLYMILDCDQELRDGRLRSPRPGLLRTLRRLEVSLTPPDGSRKGLRWSLARRFRRMRRRISGSL